ncbi:hypothetical protein Hte_006091 [Hypoxylon texense]
MYDKAIEGEFSSLASTKTRAGEGTDAFYSDEDVLKRSPKGWPSIAATQMYMVNYDSHRAFKTPTHITLINKEQKIDCIVNKLDEMDFEDEKIEGGRPLRSLPFDREKFIARCLQGPSQLSTSTPGSSPSELRMAERENLSMCLEILLKEYFTLLHMYHQNLKFPRVSRRAHEAHFQAAKDLQGLDDEACAFMRYIDDWIWPAPDTIFRRFDNLLYTKWKSLAQFLKHACCLCCFDSPPSTMSDDDPRVQYSLRGFERFVKGALGIGSMSLLVVPVAILYLKTGWSRAAYLGVVVAFSSVFCCVLTVFETNTARLLVGPAAFFAVLIAFLSNKMEDCCTA